MGATKGKDKLSLNFEAGGKLLSKEPFRKEKNKE
jgi:hypothetical protein